jgi:uncharacterized protein (TIGR00255 family)
MIRSMTGFGRAEMKDGQYEISVEIRSLNNRYLDIGLKLPKSLNTYESLLKELIKKSLVRGKVSATVNFKNLTLTNGNLRLNPEPIQFYLNLLEQIKQVTGLKDQLTLNHLLQFKEVFESEEEESEDTEITDRLTQVFQKALAELDTMRRKEAENLCKDIEERLQILLDTLSRIRETGKDSGRRELEKLYRRLSELIDAKEVDKDRLELELAIIADKVDVTEECIRLDSHIRMFRDILQTKSEVGKQLTFILQEMHRETNTIGSKTSDVTISHEIIHMKDEIEKLREQVQNLE